MPVLLRQQKSHSQPAHWPRTAENASQRSHSTREKAHKTERAARQQGSSFLRENSSNGGKTIRTFWLHSRGRGRECQGEIWKEISRFKFNYLYHVSRKTHWRVLRRVFAFFLPQYTANSGCFLGFVRVFNRFSSPINPSDAAPNSCGIPALQSRRLRLMNSTS